MLDFGPPNELQGLSCDLEMEQHLNAFRSLDYEEQ